MMPDPDREGRIFLSIPTPMIDSFSCTPFISDRRFFNNAVTSIADVRHIVMTLLRISDVNLNDGVRDVH